MTADSDEERRQRWRDAFAFLWKMNEVGEGGCYHWDGEKYVKDEQRTFSTEIIEYKPYPMPRTKLLEMSTPYIGTIGPPLPIELPKPMPVLCRDGEPHIPVLHVPDPKVHHCHRMKQHLTYWYCERCHREVPPPSDSCKNTTQS